MAEQQPLSLAETAIAVHELFTSFVDAGFTEEQAMYLVAEVVVSGRGSDSYEEEY